MRNGNRAAQLEKSKAEKSGGRAQIIKERRGSEGKHLYSPSLNFGRAGFASLCQQVSLFSKTRIIRAHYRMFGKYRKILKKSKSSI